MGEYIIYTIPKGKPVKPITAREYKLLMKETHSSNINKELERTKENWHFSEHDIISRRWNEGLWLVRLPNPIIVSPDRDNDIVAFEVMVQDILKANEFTPLDKSTLL